MATKTKKTELEKVITVLAKSKFASFGRELKISPKSKVMVNPAGFKVEYFVPTVEILIGIGKDHTASLIMAEDSWEEFKKGTELDIETVKDFKKAIK